MPRGTGARLFFLELAADGAMLPVALETGGIVGDRLFRSAGGRVICSR